MWTEALPIVVYSTCTEVVVPAADWARMYGSLQALKGHVQEYPGCQRFDAFAGVKPEGIRIDVYTTWDTIDQVEAYLVRGYTFERMLADLGLSEIEFSDTMEKIF